MLEPPVGVLFLSGAGLPPWIWDRVREQLTARPTQVAPRPHGAGVSLADHAVAALESAVSDRFVLVAHSAGGMVAAKLLELQPERVAGWLGVTCVVPRPGSSFVGSMPFPNRIVLDLVMRVLGTRPPDKALRAQAAGLPDQVVDTLVAGFVPESQRYYRDPAPEEIVPTRGGYVCTTRDHGLPVELQHSFAHRLGVDRPYELATGHLPMLEQPAVLSDLVEAFTRRASLTSPG